MDIYGLSKIIHWYLWTMHGQSMNILWVSMGNLSLSVSYLWMIQSERGVNNSTFVNHFFFICWWSVGGSEAALGKSKTVFNKILEYSFYIFKYFVDRSRSHRDPFANIFKIFRDACNVMGEGGVHHTCDVQPLSERDSWCSNEPPNGTSNCHERLLRIAEA